MVKVDVMAALETLRKGDRRVVDIPVGEVSHAPYRREPYLHARLHGRTVDAKAAAWSRTMVLLHWIDVDLEAHNEWVPASEVVRIPRRESSWQDPYDDFAWYFADSHR